MKRIHTDATVMGLGKNITLRTVNSSTSSQNPIIRVTRTPAQQIKSPIVQYKGQQTKTVPIVTIKGRPINAPQQPSGIKRTRTIVEDDSQMVTPKRLIQSTSVPIKTTSSYSSDHDIDEIIEIPPKIVNPSDLKLKPGTTFKIASGSGNKQYTILQSNGVITGIRSSDGNIIATVMPSGAKHVREPIQKIQHQQQQKQQQHHHHQQQQRTTNTASGTTTTTTATSSSGVTPARRPTIFIKGSPMKRTLRTTTTEIIEKSPKLHLGISSDRLQILKSVVCPLAEISIVDLYMTLRKLRQNEDFHMLAKYFEYTPAKGPKSLITTTLDDDNEDVDEDDDDYGEIIHTFIRTICKLSKYLKCLIRWPESKKYYDRHKNFPLQFRTLKLLPIESLVDCVEIHIQPHPKWISSYLDVNKIKSYKFLINMTLSGVITYVSDICVGNYDDLTIMNACNYTNSIPNYLSIVATEPSKGGLLCLYNKKDQSENSSNDNTDKNESNDNKISVKNISKTDNPFEISDNDVIVCSDDENDDNDEKSKRIDSRKTSKLINTWKNKRKQSSEITTKMSSSIILSTKDETTSSIYTTKIVDDDVVNSCEKICYEQTKLHVAKLRDFKILQSYNPLEPQLYLYLNEIVTVVAALCNLQR